MLVSDINYFHCVRIIEILRETEKDTKNFLGMYSSQRMKDWQVDSGFRRMWIRWILQEIESLYKKDNVNLAESAQILQRLVQYEIPALKKQIAKNDQAVVVGFLLLIMFPFNFRFYSFQSCACYSFQDTAKKEKDYLKQSADGKKVYEKELENMGLKVWIFPLLLAKE